MYIVHVHVFLLDTCRRSNLEKCGREFSQQHLFLSTTHFSVRWKSPIPSVPFHAVRQLIKSIIILFFSVQGLIVDQTIEKVSFCAPDRHNDKGFSYICRDGTTRRWLCHCFHSLREPVSHLPLPGPAQLTGFESDWWLKWHACLWGICKVLALVIRRIITFSLIIVNDVWLYAKWCCQWPKPTKKIKRLMCI